MAKVSQSVGVLLVALFLRGLGDRFEYQFGHEPFEGINLDDSSHTKGLSLGDEGYLMKVGSPVERASSAPAALASEPAEGDSAASATAIVICRAGEYVPSPALDFDLPLTEEGYIYSASMSEKLASYAPFDHIFGSPWLRARQTLLALLWPSEEERPDWRTGRPPGLLLDPEAVNKLLQSMGVWMEWGLAKTLHRDLCPDCHNQTFLKEFVDRVYESVPELKDHAQLFPEHGLSVEERTGTHVADFHRTAIWLNGLLELAKPGTSTLVVTHGVQAVLMRNMLGSRQHLAVAASLGSYELPPQQKPFGVYEPFEGWEEVPVYDDKILVPPGSCTVAEKSLGQPWNIAETFWFRQLSFKHRAGNNLAPCYLHRSECMELFA